MTHTIAIAGFLAVGGPALWLWRHRWARTQLVADLAQRVDERATAMPSAWSAVEPPRAAQTEFILGRLTHLNAVLASADLDRLRSIALDVQPYLERSLIPGHKKGGTISYEAICRHAPEIAAVYHSESLRRYLSAVVGEEVLRTPPGDQSSCSLLFYTEAGDHIGWHYDHNFYRGRHFTVLLTLENRGASGLSASILQRQTPDGNAIDVDTSPNTLVIFEGARVRHRATPIVAGDLRILLSMTFCTDPRTTAIREFARRVKDTAFYGARALWD